MSEFKNYTPKDYDALCNFLIAINKDNEQHINWNWARFEWMYEHPEFDKSSMNTIGLWWDNNKIVGAAIYDMYYGEAFCGALSGFEIIYPEILNYAYNHLKDESGIGIAINDDNSEEITLAQQQGFSVAEQTETILCKKLNHQLPPSLPEELHFEDFDPEENPYDFQWLLWQGFDHGTNRAEFEQAEEIIPQKRPNLKKNLSVVAVNEAGEKVAYCCLWYNENTDYTYVEPVCVIPSYRGKKVASAVVLEALNRAKAMGAQKAYVISDMDFYKKLRFEEDMHFTFYWKK